MNDFEGLLRLRLQAAEATLPANPPEALLAFIDTVPTVHEREQTRPMHIRRGKTLARGLALAAAAVVVAAIATQAIVNIRSSQNPGAGPSWRWYVPTGTKPEMILARVANGYLGECDRGDATVVPCSSRDGIAWSVPADPAVANLDGDVPDGFLPRPVEERNGVYVAISIGVGTPTGLLVSNDGTTWTALHSDAIDAVMGAEAGVSYGEQLATLPDRFLVIAGSSQDLWAFTSADGTTWTRASRAPTTGLNDVGYGAAGFFLQGDEGKVWRTVDGASWLAVDSPSGPPNQVVSVPGGGYVAATRSKIVKSMDGVTWREDQGDLVGYPFAFAAVGGRLLVSVTASPDPADPVGDGQVWESLDWGATWRPLLGPDGTQFHGRVQAIGDAVAIIQKDRMLESPAYVGFLDGRTIASAPPATPRPTPTPTPTERPVPTRLPDAARAEWSWQATDGTRFEFPIAVPGGWLATCGTPGTSEFAEAGFCWSADGLHWTESAQQEFVEAEGSDPFWPIHAVQSGGVYVAFSLSRPIPFTGSGTPVLWRSTDGHSWTELHPPAFAGYEISDVGLLGDRFVTIGTSPDRSSGIVLGSADGASWSKLADTPASPNGWSATVFGLVVSTGVNSLGGSWVSADGATWVKATLPAGVTHLRGFPVRLADGDYMDVGYDFNSATHDTLMKSADGVAWTAVPTPDGRPMSFDQVGGRLILTTSLGESNEAPYVAWQSGDDGQTWQSLPDPDGFPVDQITSSFGDAVTITYGDVPKIWIGTPTGG
jgi:hypothetical protein